MKMRIQTLTLILAALVSSLGAATPVAPATIHDRLAPFKRGIDGNTPAENVNYHLNYIVNQLRSFVHDDYFDFAKFNENSEDLYDDIYWTQNLAETKLPRGAWQAEFVFVRNFLESISEAAKNNQMLAKCNYWGSDLVKQMELLNFKMSALHNVIDVPLTTEYYTKRASFEHDLKVLEDRASKDTVMSEGVRKMFNRENSKAQVLIKLLRDAEDDEDNDAKKIENVTCPVI